MADRIDRDRSIEHLLRQTLSYPSSAPSSDCVDAERLAAWTAGSLRPDESAAVEGHVADCAHCQALLAVFVESEPVVPAAIPFWQRWTVRWLAPVAAVGAAVFVWAVVTREPEMPAPMTMARVEQAPQMEPPPVAPADSLRSSEASPSTSAPPMPPAPGASAPAGSLAQNHAAAKPSPPPASAPGAAPLPAPMPASPPPSPPPVSTRSSAEEQPPVAEEAVRDAGAVARQQQGSIQPSAAALRAEERSVALAEAADAAPTAVPAHARIDASASESVEFMAPARARVGMFVTQGGRADLASSVPLERWRIRQDGRVERSTDAGQSWSPVTLAQSLFITAGSAPVEGVCWLVDRGGVVLRSINNSPFTPTAFTGPGPLVAVQATDGNHAVVMTADGRLFTTADGGTTWRGN